MRKLGILLDNASPKQLNSEVFSALKKIHSEDKNLSVNIFLKNVNWPFTDVPYGFFKWHDYQNFRGTTIVTNIELLNFVQEVPHNNKIILYCNSFPWVDSNIQAKNTLSHLTNLEIDIYSQIDYIADFLKTFNREVKICSIEKLMRDLLWQ